MREFKTGDRVRLNANSPYYKYFKRTTFVVLARRHVSTVPMVIAEKDKDRLNAPIEHFHETWLYHLGTDLFTIIDDHIKSLEQS